MRSHALLKGHLSTNSHLPSQLQESQSVLGSTYFMYMSDLFQQVLHSILYFPF